MLVEVWAVIPGEGPFLAGPFLNNVQKPEFLTKFTSDLDIQDLKEKIRQLIPISCERIDLIINDKFVVHSDNPIQIDFGDKIKVEVKNHQSKKSYVGFEIV